ncbi:adenosylcobinamide-GDP ribazoletransferase [Pseudaestuariivita atlantica]|uniref:Adenosylcobinamide-GDP ribazoletransferase n=1 Tax=Pseudaestuariivita atlantica TaxID=1317121 RepID=A0A0L1JQF6_9RHOB|nr:adenosylcobinamide-GDP ribazoletransferase [Pseudaestuariivita atlantica]KNG94009.1 hypothetical protein ATO11_07045 [Pseudaestuariivita atlantica]
MSRRAEVQIAAMLLTRLPAGHVTGRAPEMGQTLWAWPVIGAALGIGAALVMWITGALGVPAVLSGALALAALALATGGLHEDGLADVADGFGGGATRERKLDIMRDSRVGSYGVLALVFAVGLRLVAMVEIADWGALALGLIVLAATSRAMMGLPLTLLPPARADGLGASTQVEQSQSLIAGALALGLALVLLGSAGFVAFAVALAAAYGLTALARRQIGGQTGDVCGATQVVSETAGWIALAAMLG